MKQPSIIVVLLIALSVSVSSCSDTSAKKEPENKTDPPAAPHFVLATVERQSVNQAIKLPAQLAAYEEVSIFPKVNGYVTSVLVDIGSHVKKGQLLMVLNAPELEESVVQAKERWARSLSGYAISRDNYERLLQAARTPGAISPMDLASARSKKEADSSLSNAEKANWQMQQTMTGYLRVTAPFGGVITQRNVHPGALVSNESKDKPMLELKEVDHLRLQVDIPEGVAGSLKPGQELAFYLSAWPGKKMTGLIKRVSMNINMQYRTERVELDVYNKEETLSPGMYADVVFDSKGNPDALSVPRSAVVTSTERKYVIAVRGGRTMRVDVTTGNESNSRIEVIGDLRAGEEVIVNGSDDIKEGVYISR
ncbi:MAG TPA: efflux RND transporter periplasmic adaptor subunit [Puia sp.]|nr:efflux RND transporter periplasmic adaptor subunit [Puia sp.]